MKKVIILLVLVLCITACSNKIEKKEEQVEEENKDEETINQYVDENNTVIGLYTDDKGPFELVHEYKTNIIDGKDIAVFSIYPSQEEVLKINERYGISFYNKWITNENYKNLKIGFNVKFTTKTGEKVSFNILEPGQTFESNIIYSYLYDDYANRSINWYSHIEQSEYTEDTLYTAIKLYASMAEDTIDSKIILTIFTYDGLDDFDEDGNYRGNSSYTAVICDIEKTC